MTYPSTNPRGADPRKRPAFRPRAEGLEGRLLLSTTAGELDGSFGTRGYVLTNSPAVARDGSPVGDEAYAVAIQPDGKILAAGDRKGAWAFEVVRLNRDGSLDDASAGDSTPGDSFGSAGRVIPPLNGQAQAYDMALQIDPTTGLPDGRIVLAGYVTMGTGRDQAHHDVALVRLLPDGTLDTTFGPNGDGKVTMDVRGLGLNDGAMTVAIQPDGKIVVGGRAGGTDPNFNDGLLLRYNADGSLDDGSAKDTTPGDRFGVGGKVLTSWATDRSDYIIGVAIQADGKIVACGSIALQDGMGPHARYLARYNADGSLDDRSAGDTTPGDAFGTGGRVDLPFTTVNIGYWQHPIAIQEDGAIVWAGQGSNGTDEDVAVARLTTTGAFDTTFGALVGAARTGSMTIPLAGTDQAKSVTIQRDGKLVVVGVAGADSFIARLESDGTLDSSFRGGGLAVHSFSSGSDDILRDVAVQADGKLVAVGMATPPGLTRPAFLIARFEGMSPPGIAVSPASGLVTTEGGGTASFRVALTTRPTADVTIPVGSGNPAEGAVSTSSLTFTPDNWNVAQSVTVTGLHDDFLDGDVPYTIDLGAATSADPTYHGLDPRDISVTNRDDEVGLSINDASIAEGNTGTRSLVFTVTRSGDPTRAVSVGFATANGTATAGSDYAARSGTLSFAAGETTKTIAVTVSGDRTVEPDENFTVTLSGASAGVIVARGQATGTILNDDTRKLVAATTARTGTRSTPLSPQALGPLVDAALALWRGVGVDVSGLAGLRVRLADLPGDELGEADGTTITLDRDAAGWGWYVDRTPSASREFHRPGRGPATRRMDLLTALVHEVGHLLGHDHAEGGVMVETLAPGERRLAADQGGGDAPESGPDRPLAALPRVSSRLSLQAFWGRGRKARAAARG